MMVEGVMFCSNSPAGSRGGLMAEGSVEFSMVVLLPLSTSWRDAASYCHRDEALNGAAVSHLFSKYLKLARGL